MRHIFILIGLVFVASCASRKSASSDPQAGSPSESPSLRSELSSLFGSTNQVAIMTNAVVFMTGEVERPGPIKWSSSLTLTNAVSLAGGFTDFANWKRIVIHHQDGQVERYSYLQAVDDGTNNPPLRPDDIVRVGGYEW